MEMASENLGISEGSEKQEVSPLKLWKEEKQCILAVDDMPENIEIIRNLLGREYQIKAATKGSKAIEIARRKPQPDLILLDVMMPEMSGFEVCRILKTDADTVQIPIIFITGNNDSTNEFAGFEIGATDYISKPFHPAVIRSRVQTHLQLQKEKSRVDQLLENIFPRRIIQDIKFRGFCNPELFDPVTLMVTELLPPRNASASVEQTIAEITDLFTVLDGLLVRRGAERINAINYTHIAACGIPVANINHASIIMQTATDFMSFFNLSQQYCSKGWQVRIGIHTGSVIGSIVGRRRYSYDIFGEDIRMALQTKNVAPPMSLLVTGNTMQSVKDSYSFDRFTPAQMAIPDIGLYICSRAQNPI